MTAPPFSSPDVPEIVPVSTAGQRVLFGARPACVGHDPELWFAVDPERSRQAKRVCRSCPLVDDCLTHALRSETYGTWGGLTEDERRDVRWRRWSWAVPDGDSAPDRSTA